MKAIKQLSKGEKTRMFILETVAPVFNKKGYAGTSMADITKATGLTKGAIYGNFGSKEDLALEAFNLSFKRIITKLNAKVAEHSSPLEKLHGITTFYRNYYTYVYEYGGCPIVNISVDTHFQNPQLFKRVTEVMARMIEKMEDLIKAGIKEGQIKKDCDPVKYARLIFAQIEGGVFVSIMTKSPECLTDVVNQVDEMIKNEMAL